MVLVRRLLIGLFLQVSLNLILVTLIIYRKVLTTRISGNNLILISNPGEEISDFLPIIVSSSKIFILVLSDILNNETMVDTRFRYTCQTISSIERCLIKYIPNMSADKMEKTIYNVCKKYQINHIFTYSSLNHNPRKNILFDSASSALKRFDSESETKYADGRMIMTDQLFNSFLDKNMTRNYPFSYKPTLYYLLETINFRTFLSLFEGTRISYVCALSPFSKIDKRITYGLTNVKLMNAFMRKDNYLLRI